MNHGHAIWELEAKAWNRRRDPNSTVIWVIVTILRTIWLAEAGVVRLLLELGLAGRTRTCVTALVGSHAAGNGCVVD